MELLRSSLQLESVSVTDDYVLLAESNLTGDMWDGLVSVHHRLPGRVTPLTSAHQMHGVAEATWWSGAVVCICDSGDLVAFPSQSLEGANRVQAHHGLGVALAVTPDRVISASEDE